MSITKAKENLNLAIRLSDAESMQRVLRNLPDESKVIWGGIVAAMKSAKQELEG